ncbi:hypothetical protein BCR32DRAFT_241710 [Anaeromyces robustus]|uniref:CBM1 domain-containing protein n=1 Tax=Anaeromyces robustus TaxID=1754192 RepID=A0A1Y1XIK6_9FUNG|nr:hypothetical protein BCR32DRAFT_241710 [Anaeromyces robustus]|eukprot:ORX85532.1 hypothetical protein BCR32DRAFT_241710 [Anaeromyces robustus]
MRFNTELLLSLLATVLLFGTSEAVPNGYHCGYNDYGTCQNYRGGCNPGYVRLYGSSGKSCDDGYCCMSVDDPRAVGRNIFFYYCLILIHDLKSRYEYNLLKYGLEIYFDIMSTSIIEKSKV